MAFKQNIAALVILAVAAGVPRRGRLAKIRARRRRESRNLSVLSEAWRAVRGGGSAPTARTERQAGDVGSVADPNATDPNATSFGPERQVREDWMPKGAAEYFTGEAKSLAERQVRDDWMPEGAARFFTGDFTVKPLADAPACPKVYVYDLRASGAASSPRGRGRRRDALPGRHLEGPRRRRDAPPASPPHLERPRKAAASTRGTRRRHSAEATPQKAAAPPRRAAHTSTPRRRGGRRPEPSTRGPPETRRPEYWDFKIYVQSRRIGKDGYIKLNTHVEEIARESFSDVDPRYIFGEPCDKGVDLEYGQGASAARETAGTRFDSTRRARPRPVARIFR